MPICELWMVKLHNHLLFPVITSMELPLTCVYLSVYVFRNILTAYGHLLVVGRGGLLSDASVSFSIFSFLFLMYMYILAHSLTHSLAYLHTHILTSTSTLSHMYIYIFSFSSAPASD